MAVRAINTALASHHRWETLLWMGMNLKTTTRSSALLGTWVLRNVHPGTSVLMTTSKSPTPEQPSSIIHHKQAHGVSSRPRQHDFIRARMIWACLLGVTHYWYTWLLRKQTSAGRWRRGAVPCMFELNHERRISRRPFACLRWMRLTLWSKSESHRPGIKIYNDVG